MIYAICIGRDGSRGFPLKNTHKINGMPLMAYPIQAAYNSKQVDEVYFSTESRKLKYIAEKWGATVIDRPKKLSTDEALSDDVWSHGFNWILDNVLMGAWRSNVSRSSKIKQIEFLVLLFANAVGINTWMLDEMIEKLRDDAIADSICTVSSYPTFTPYRMRKIDSDGFLVPFIDNIDWDEISCDRDSGGKPYIYDCCCAVVKPKCIEEIGDGMPPQKWLGRRILPYENLSPIFDIDFPYQIEQLKFWADNHWY